MGKAACLVCRDQLPLPAPAPTVKGALLHLSFTGHLNLTAFAFLHHFLNLNFPLQAFEPLGQ